MEISITTEDWVNWEDEAIKDELRKAEYHLQRLEISKINLKGGFISQRNHMESCEYHKRWIRHPRERYRVLTRKRESEREYS